MQYRVSDSAGRYQEGELLPIRQSAPPRFLTAGRSLGRRYGAFSVPYEAEDPFPDARLSLQLALDGNTLETAQGLQSPLRLSAAVGESAFSALAPDSAHTLCITLTNEFSQSASLCFSFTAAADPSAGCTFYLLRDGVPIAKKADTGPFFDYGAAGSHRYRVRLVDPQGGFCDSNEVTAFSRLESAVIAPLDRPGQMIPLPLHEGSTPPRQSLMQQEGQLLHFEGRDYAVLEQGSRRGQRFTIGALADEQIYRQVLALAEEGAPILYRDPYGNCAAAAIEAMPATFSAQGVQLELQLVRLDETGEVGYD